MADKKVKYLIDYKKLGKHFETPRECIDTLYDEFRLHGIMYKGKVKVNYHTKHDVDKLKKFLKKYDADPKYIKEVLSVDESYDLSVKNNDIAMAKLSLNDNKKIDESFDHVEDGVQQIEINDIAELIPSRVKMGKRVIIFLYDKLVSQFASIIKRTIPGIYDRMVSVRWDVLKREIEENGNGRIDAEFFDAQGDAPVFVIVFHDDSINDLIIDDELPRLYSMVVIGGERSTPVYGPFEPDEVGYPGENDDVDYQEQVDEAAGDPDERRGRPNAVPKLDRRMKMSDKDMRELGYTGPTVHSEDALAQCIGKGNLLVWQMTGTGAGNLLRDLCDDYTFNAGTEDVGDTVLINVRSARDEEIQEDLDTNPGFVIFDRILSVGEEKAMEILDMAVEAGLDGKIIAIANINGNVEPNMVSEDFLSRFESEGYSGIIEYDPELDGDDDDYDGIDEMYESMSQKRKKAINESKTNTNKNMDLKDRSRRLSLNERFDDDETSVENTRPTHDQLLEQVLELKKNSYPDGKYDGNGFVKSVLNLLHESGLSTVDVRKDPEYADIFVEQLFNTVSLEETYSYFKKGNEDHLDEAEKVDEAEKAPKSENGNKSVDGKKLKEYKLVELKDLLQAKKDKLKELKKELKAAEKAGKGADKVQKLIDKVNAEIEMIKSEIAFRKANKMNESVRGNFSKYAKIYESEDISEGDDDDNDDAADDADKAEDADADKDDAADDADDKKDDEKDSDSKDNDVPMTAVLVKVAKEDVDKAKKQMIDAGVEEDDIDVVEGDEDADEVEIKVDANSIMALKDWLDTKGIDLEEKLGGEIVPPDEDGAEDSDDSSDDDSADDSQDDSEEGDGLDLDNMNFDDIFGDEKE